MPKSTTELHLAESTIECRDLERQIEDLVDVLTRKGEGQGKSAYSLFMLLEILTDYRVNEEDRDFFSGHAMARAFMYSNAGKRAMEEEIQKINPKVEMPRWLRKAG